METNRNLLVAPRAGSTGAARVLVTMLLAGCVAVLAMLAIEYVIPVRLRAESAFPPKTVAIAVTESSPGNQGEGARTGAPASNSFTISSFSSLHQSIATQDEAPIVNYEHD